MLLETISKDGIIIFSENSSDFNHNFKIIEKKSGVKKEKIINFFDVCSFIINKEPKKLILYRVLVNLKTIELSKAYYGIFIYVNGKLELLFPDPIYAVNELENFINKNNLRDFRFVIQQVGLTSTGLIGDHINFKELFYFDLHASDAITTNDRSFVDGLFMSSSILKEKKEHAQKITPKSGNVKRMHIISPEQLDFEKKDNYYRRDVSSSEKREEVSGLIHKVIKEDNSPSTFRFDKPKVDKKGEVHENKKVDVEQKQKTQKETVAKDLVVDVFKSGENSIPKRKKEKIILKFN